MLAASRLHRGAGSSTSFTEIRKEAGLFCGSFLRKGEVFDSLGRNQSLKDPKNLNFYLGLFFAVPATRFSLPPQHIGEIVPSATVLFQTRGVVLDLVDVGWQDMNILSNQFEILKTEWQGTSLFVFNLGRYCPRLELNKP